MLLAGPDADFLLGELGDDTYLFSSSNVGGGVIEDNGGFDTLVMAEGISPQQFRFSRDDNNLILQTASMRITLKRFFEEDRFFIEQVRFSNGAIWDQNFLFEITGQFLYGTSGSDSLLGGVGPDQLMGGQGDDILDGRAGDDELIGDAGNDTLINRSELGEYWDWMEGGAGDDIYIVNPQADSYIFDASGFDTLRIEGEVLPGHVSVDFESDEYASYFLLSFDGISHRESVIIEAVNGLNPIERFEFSNGEISPRVRILVAPIEPRTCGAAKKDRSGTIRTRIQR